MKIVRHSFMAVVIFAVVFASMYYFGGSEEEGYQADNADLRTLPFFIDAVFMHVTSFTPDSIQVYAETRNLSRNDFQILREAHENDSNSWYQP